MPVLVLFGILGGLVTGISPCIIPVLPVILAAGAGSGVGTEGSGVGSEGSGSSVERRRLQRRPYAVVGGLMLSFGFATLVGSSVLSVIGLPQDFLRTVGLIVLGVVAVGLIVPFIGALVERPFVRLTMGHQLDRGGGLVLGLSLGLLFVPCAGPVLTAISVVGAKHRIGFSAVLLTVSFSIGVAIPLLAFAVGGQRLAAHLPSIRTRAALVRKLVGVVLLVVAVLIGFNLTSGLQTALPGYTDALTQHLEGNTTAKVALGSVSGNDVGGALSSCTDASPVLQRCGTAPAFTGIAQWLNTPEHRPLTLAGLRGRTVLVDFWTYSCINCQRTLPHLEAWNRKYASKGLTIVGVHTPEFAFEHVVSNVVQAARQLGVHYPIAIDNQYATWNAYQNEYWPAEYLIDATGEVRHVDFGEGQYSQTEGFIRALLRAANPSVRLPGASHLIDTTPTEPTTPESYLGASHPTNLDGQTIQEGHDALYVAPPKLPQNEYAYNGRWNIGSEASTSVAGASIALHYQAKNVYLVLGGSGTATVSFDGVQQKVLNISGEPKLPQLIGAALSQTGLLAVSLTSGVAAYDFTYG